MSALSSIEEETDEASVSRSEVSSKVQVQVKVLTVPVEKFILCIWPRGNVFACFWVMRKSIQKRREKLLREKPAWSRDWTATLLLSIHLVHLTIFNLHIYCISSLRIFPSCVNMFYQHWKKVCCSSSSCMNQNNHISYVLHIIYYISLATITLAILSWLQLSTALMLMLINYENVRHWKMFNTTFISLKQDKKYLSNAVLISKYYILLPQML